MTIPQDIREKAGLLPHTEVEFLFDGRTVCLVKAQGRKTRGAAFVSRMKGRGDVKLTTDEIMALTRPYARNK